MKVQNKKWPRFCLTLSAMAMLSAFPSVQAASAPSAAPANSQQERWIRKFEQLL
ncbi:hypothetical protein [Acinetobacter sp. YH12103]|uniref:hypothetical protein n=1 Tax=Acinetobacter sp. YH12103 TaxID=2601092 RepID=UPI00211EF79B|nr:hypothetical protein [Acinetobacter sp. YH12103]